MVWGLLATFISGLTLGYLRGSSNDRRTIKAEMDRLNENYRDATRRQWAGSKTLYMTEIDTEHEWTIAHPFTVHSN